MKFCVYKCFSCLFFFFYVSVAGALFLLAYGGVIFLLGSYAAAAVASAMQASSVAAVIGSKVATPRLILQTRTPNLDFTLVAPVDLTFFFF